MKLWRKNEADSLKYEFLPAAEEIIESPTSPYGHIVLWSITALILIALIWSYVGRIDVIASAQGKVVPQGNVKVVQPSSQGIIKSINVSEGEKVKKGQLLVELDPSLNANTVSSLETSLATAQLERDVLVKVTNGEGTSDVIAQSSVPQSIKDDLLALATSKASATNVHREFLSLGVTQAKSQLATERQNQKTLESSLQAAQDKQKALQQQYDSASSTQQVMMQSQLQDANNQVQSLQSALMSQKARVGQAETGVTQANSSLNNYSADSTSTSMSTIIDQDKRIADIEASLTKAKKDVELQSLTAPADGTVLSIASTTIGGVVTPAQPLVTIVPTDTPLVIEASLSPSDVGFVKTGQKVAVKVDAFSFQRYGYLTGTVKSISPDVLSDDKKGPYYKMIITLDGATTSKSNSIQVIPGMTATNEVATGNRRIIEFFLDPLMTHTDESLKVR